MLDKFRSNLVAGAAGAMSGNDTLDDDINSVATSPLHKKTDGGQRSSEEKSSLSDIEEQRAIAMKSRYESSELPRLRV